MFHVTMFVGGRVTCKNGFGRSFDLFRVSRSSQRMRQHLLPGMLPGSRSHIPRRYKNGARCLCCNLRCAVKITACTRPGQGFLPEVTSQLLVLVFLRGNLAMLRARVGSFFVFAHSSLRTTRVPDLLPDSKCPKWFDSYPKELVMLVFGVCFLPTAAAACCFQIPRVMYNDHLQSRVYLC